jgi:hypothetical protein
MKGPTSAAQNAAEMGQPAEMGKEKPRVLAPSKMREKTGEGPRRPMRSRPMQYFHNISVHDIITNRSSGHDTITE